MVSDNDSLPPFAPSLQLLIDTLSVAASIPPARIKRLKMYKRWHDITSEKFLHDFALVPSDVPEDMKNLPKKELKPLGLFNETQAQSMYSAICSAFNEVLDLADDNKPRVQMAKESRQTLGEALGECLYDKLPSEKTDEERASSDQSFEKAGRQELCAKAARGKYTSPEQPLEEATIQGQHTETVEGDVSEAQHVFSCATSQATSVQPTTGPNATTFAPLAKDSQPPATKCARYTFKDVTDTPEPANEAMNINIAMYPTTSAARNAYELDEATLFKTTDVNRRQHLARTAWAWMTVGVEVKRNRTHAAFHFGEPGSAEKALLRDSRRGRAAQARLVEHATEMMVRQHRTHVFIIYIAEDYARLTRWDRVGCIVSEPIDLRTDSYTLLNFVYRLGLMSDAALGFDTSAVLATKAEVAALERINHRNPYARQRAREVLDNQRFFPIYKVRCREPKGVKPKGWKPGKYFIGKYISASHSPTGRGTRGYVAFKEGATRLFFLKDYWRPSFPAVPVELAVYERLHEKGVIFIAQVDGGGDVEADDAVQHTVAQDYLSGFGEDNKRLHSRLVFVELARPLEDYQNSSVLIILLSYALRAHRAAWEEAGVLHCDISVNNIMRVVYQDRETDGPVHGILNDWDMSKSKNDIEEKDAQSGRTGTWAFMSAVLLQCPYKPNDLADDLESFVHVLTWCCLRFHMHDMTIHSFGVTLDEDSLRKANGGDGPLWRHVDRFFDESWECQGGVEAGGKHKLSAARHGDPGFELDRTRVSADLITLLESLYRLLKEHYSTLDWAELGQYKAKIRRPEVISVDPAPSVTRGQTARWNRDDDSDIEDDIEDDIGPDPFQDIPSTNSVSRPLASRTLNAHSAISQLFKQAMDSIRDKVNSKGVVLNDKTQDQFIGLRKLVLFSRRSASGHSSSERESDSDTSHGEQAKKMRYDSTNGTVNE